MAKRAVFDFGLNEAPRARQKQDWMDVARDTKAIGAAALENARLLSLDRIEPGPWQVRRDFRSAKMAELVESVRARGVLEPILVRATGDDQYQIIAGERRFRAAREVGLESIPALVLDLDDTGARVVSLMENIQRDDLNEVERAEGLVALKGLTGSTWDEIGRLIGISKRHVLHLVSLTRLPAAVQRLVRDGHLSAKHGRLIAYVHDPRLQEALADVAADLRLNAHQTAEAVKRVGSEPRFTGIEGSALSAEELRERMAGLVANLRAPSTCDPAPPPAPHGDLLAAITRAREAIEAADPRAITPELVAPAQEGLAVLIRACQGFLDALADGGRDA